MHEKITQRRTIRKYSKRPVPKEVLVKCVDAARLAPSGMNRQPLKYVVVNDDDLLGEVFSATRWAGYLPDYGPTNEEMPMAYIVILLDKEVREHCGHDAGIAAMTIAMVAHDHGLGSCMLGAIDRPKLREMLEVPQRFDIVLAVALGFAAEAPTADEVKDGDTKYWLDRNGVLHVPKRSFEEIVRWNKWSDKL
jgi:nitroreductase